MTTIRVISLAGVRRHWRLVLAIGLAAALAAARPPAAAAPGGPAAGAVLFRVPTDRRLVALTFDDGPSPRNTPRILALLRQFHMTATFFVVGQEVDRYPQVVRELVAAGDEVGNHSFSHPNLAHHGPSAIRRQLEETQAAVVRAAGIRPTLMRPPYGAYNPQVLAVAGSLGLRVVLWSAHQDTRDWANPPVDRIVSHVLAHLAPGDIVLFHDGAGSRHTVAAVAVLLRALQAGGWRAVTVSQLLAAAAPSAPAASP